MDFNVNILFTKPDYKWVQNVPIQTIDVYYKFINWVAGEFNLHLQEESSGLKVYYPGEWFCIKNIKQFERNDNIEIIIMSKSKKVCVKKGIQLVSIYN
ncbi:hypothetical protein [Wocania ichthyoenteri]|uniref:hypothetical protein n=1 Tax=Wocania ichthyoenteri TaxID=1230531 RepID=UPI00053EDBF4|nr:hypothetical protein [Wocania ichthyoenteri]